MPTLYFLGNVTAAVKMGDTINGSVHFRFGSFRFVSFISFPSFVLFCTFRLDL